MLSVGNLGVCATSAHKKMQFVRGVNKSWESMTDHLCSCTSACMFREWSSRHSTFPKKTNRRLYFVLFGTGSCESWPRTPPALCSRCCDAQSMQLLNKKNGDRCLLYPPAPSFGSFLSCAFAVRFSLPFLATSYTTTRPPYFLRRCARRAGTRSALSTPSTGKPGTGGSGRPQRSTMRHCLLLSLLRRTAMKVAPPTMIMPTPMTRWFRARPYFYALRLFRFAWSSASISERRRAGRPRTTNELSEVARRGLKMRLTRQSGQLMAGKETTPSGWLGLWGAP